MKLLERLYQITDIHRLAEEMSLVFQEAIIIENNQFELVAYGSPEEQLYDPIQQKTILAKRCPLYVIERLKKEGIFDQLAAENKPIRIQRMEDIDFYERVVISLKSQGEICGYLWLCETEKLTDKDFAFLEDIAPHLAKCLDSQTHGKQDVQQKLIWSLLNDDFLNDAEIYQTAKMISWPVPEEFTVIAYSIKDAGFVYVLEKIKEILSEAGLALYLGKGTEIIGIVDEDNGSRSLTRTKSILQQVTNSLDERERASVYLGIGGTYERISLMRKSYLEALEVIETMVFLNIKTQVIHYFSDLGFYRYVKLMYKKNVSEQYRNTSLIKLMQADMENKSELLKTLWFYLKNDCKVAKTADALFIHPNTLNYRLKQIGNIVYIDFGNMEVKMELYSELMLIHLIPDYKELYLQNVVKLPPATIRNVSDDDYE